MRKLQSVLSIGFVFASVLILQVACRISTVPPTVTLHSPIPLDRGGGVWVIALRQRTAIVASLENAGIMLTRDLASTEYALDVRVGSGRGGGKCGSVHNVAYILTGRHAQRLMVIKGRGAAASWCGSSVFQDMSEALATEMGGVDPAGALASHSVRARASDPLRAPAAR